MLSENLRESKKEWKTKNVVKDNEQKIAINTFV